MFRYTIKMRFATSILIFFLLFPFEVNAYSDSDQCRRQIIQLGGDLKIILRKINIMPTISKIYPPLKRAFDDSIRAQRRGDFATCIQKTNIALKYSKAYAR